jgi:hypothetical protein
MKRTLRRESKALEIVGREAPGASPGALRAVRWWGGASSRRRPVPDGVGDGGSVFGVQTSSIFRFHRLVPAAPPGSEGRSASAWGATGGRGLLGRGEGQPFPAGRSRRPSSLAPRMRGPAPRPSSQGGAGRGGRVPGASHGRGPGNPALALAAFRGMRFLPQRSHGRRRGGPRWPVLKHGPRSPTRARAGGPHEPRTRSEGEGVPGSRARSPEVGRLSFGRVRTIGRPGFSRKVRAGARPSGPERSRTMGDQDEARGNSEPLVRGKPRATRQWAALGSLATEKPGATVRGKPRATGKGGNPRANPAKGRLQSLWRRGNPESYAEKKALSHPAKGKLQGLWRRGNPESYAEKKALSHPAKGKLELFGLGETPVKW